MNYANQKTIAVDFDGTIVEDCYPAIGKSRTFAFDTLKRLQNDGHRVVKAKWAKNKEISLLTGVIINGIDDVGVIHKITNVVSGELKMNMRSMSIDSKDGLFEGKIMVYVNHKEELDELSKRLEKLEGINKVTRLDSE